uniref:Uncharacterized protein n=1 Tax=Salvator merianae TaxID=96440 RepID=A0A8D0BVJ3_SALMN
VMAYIIQISNSKCWHGCQRKGLYMHMWWECDRIKELWKLIEREIHKIVTREVILMKQLCIGHSKKRYQLESGEQRPDMFQYPKTIKLYYNLFFKQHTCNTSTL